ncbi:MAG: flagellar hook capping FlgD N-terminal domain-containing protein [Pseudomonadota bacterium]
MSDPITLVPNQVADTSLSGNIFAQESSDSAALAQDFDDFLTLLTTQLQNQDPLDPTDTTEFTNQLVMFNQVEQQIRSNEKLDTLINVTQASALQQALGYIGLDVSFEGQEFYNAGNGTSNRFIYDLSGEVDDLTLRVVDSDGETVYTQKGSGIPGLQVIEWDGIGDDGQPVQPGNYSLQLDIVPVPGNESVAVELGVSSRVTGIETRAGEIFLAMGDLVVPLSQVFSAELPVGSTNTLITDDETGTDTGSDTGADDTADASDGTGDSADNSTDNSGDDTASDTTGSDTTGSDTTGDDTTGGGTG